MGCMFWDEEITPEEVDEVIDWMAREIYKYGMEVAAILFLESSKPVTFVGSQFGQAFLTPFLPFLGDEMSVKGNKAMRVFEDRENVERLITRLEGFAVHPPKPPAVASVEVGGGSRRKGWRRFLPF